MVIKGGQINERVKRRGDRIYKFTKEYRAFLFKGAVYVAVMLRKIQLQNLNTVIAFPFI